MVANIPFNINRMKFFPYPVLSCQMTLVLWFTITFYNSNGVFFSPPAPVLWSTFQPVGRGLPKGLSSGWANIWMLLIPADIDPTILSCKNHLLLPPHQHLNHIAGQEHSSHDACRRLLVTPAPLVAPDLVGQVGEPLRHKQLLILHKNAIVRVNVQLTVSVKNLTQGDFFII